MTVDWADKGTRRLALEGKMEAMREGNLDAVQMFNHNRRLGKAPGLEQVRYAVIECGCDRSIVYDIMSSARTWGLRGPQWSCSILDSWCENSIEVGNPKAKWLKLKLNELRTAHGAVRNRSTAVVYGYMDPKAGDYDDVEGETLIIRDSKENQLSSLEARTARGGLISYHEL